MEPWTLREERHEFSERSWTHTVSPLQILLHLLPPPEEMLRDSGAVLIF